MLSAARVQLTRALHVATTLGGLGAHQLLVDGQIAHTQQLYVYEKTKYAYQLVGSIGLWVIKLSVLFLYRRIFSVGAFRLANTVMICITVAWGLAFTFAMAFQCSPVSTIWEKFELEYGNSCVSVQPFYLAAAICDLVLDILILLLPVHPLWLLQMPIRQKLAVGGIFFLGFMSVLHCTSETTHSHIAALLLSELHAWSYSSWSLTSQRRSP